MNEPRIKLLVRRDERLECLWELSREMADAVPTDNPPDLFVEMKKAVSLLSEDDMSSDAVFVANRAGRFYMDVQGMRSRNKIVTVSDPASVPIDTFHGIRLAVSDNLS